MASSTQMKGMSLLKAEGGKLHDALPTLPPWADQKNPAVWAPDVVRLAGGGFVLYFSATSSQNANRHCIGAATAQTVTGPYTPMDAPLACPLSVGGAIDPAGFIDSDGKAYVVYKIDGNSLGGSGPCGNGEGEFSTPIKLQEVSATDGYTLIGSPTELVDRSPSDGPLIEAPSLFRSVEGTYVLFFSSNCYRTNFYDTSYATSQSVKGPYTKSQKPLITTGMTALYGPGGTDVSADGSTIVFHADATSNDATVRQIYSSGIEVDGTTVFLS